MNLTKTNFKRNLSHVEVSLIGNSYCYLSDDNVNLIAKINLFGKPFTVIEEHGNTNGGENWSSFYIYDGDAIIYSDHASDGNGAWQTDDNIKSKYSDLTEFMSLLLHGYLLF